MRAAWLKRSLIALAFLLTLVAAIGAGLLGSHEGPGEIQGPALPDAVVQAREARQAVARETITAGSGKTILFGDFHTHTTLSMDAFFSSMDFAIGGGPHPQADACDFARYCSALDFWSINDHAEFLTRERWDETIRSVRECNARAQDPRHPDTVAFLGWEWTQIGNTPEDHWGHRNVVLRGLADDEIPMRPIAANPTRATDLLATLNFAARTALSLAFIGNKRVQDFALYAFETAMARPCPQGIAVRDLPPDCMESAATPEGLQAKLRDWGHAALVIPHGSSWGMYTPAGSSWRKQLNAQQHDPQLQTLIEVYSGHGNIEEYRAWRGVSIAADGGLACPPDSPAYTPLCRRAGEIIRARCLAEGAHVAECEQRADIARRNFIAAPTMLGEATVAQSTVQDWLDAGQCRDCFQPPWYHRPGNSAQYALALSDFDAPGPPLRFRFGFIGSSDVHTARPGTGYKEYDRFHMADFQFPLQEQPELTGTPPAHSIAFEDLPELSVFSDTALLDDRPGAFYQTGGLVALHSRGRQRDQIWAALTRREVYATSGPRILLWFDLVNAPAPLATLPMGSEVAMDYTPRFEVRAVGSFKQLPGCPEYAQRGLAPERLARLCRGECYHPSEERKRVTRIEVVRIRPQQYPDEPVEPLIEDPWLVLPCAPEPTGCSVEFSDPDFGTGRRDSLYYVRAIEEPGLAVNGAQLDCSFDDTGNCQRIHPRAASREDDRLAAIEERAWSSPIFVDYAMAHDAKPGDVAGKR